MLYSLFTNGLPHFPTQTTHTFELYKVTTRQQRLLLKMFIKQSTLVKSPVGMITSVVSFANMVYILFTA